MRVISFVLSLSLVLSQSAFAEVSSKVKDTLSEGTTVHLKLEEPLSTKTAEPGQKIQFSVLEDVTGDDGKTVLVKGGTPAIGYLTNVDQKDMVKGGKLTIQVTSVKAVNGQKVALRCVQAKNGGDGSGIGSYVLGGVCLGVVGLGIAALAKRSHSAKMPAGTIVTAYIDKDTEVALDEPSDSGSGVKTQLVSRPAADGASSASK